MATGIQPLHPQGVAIAHDGTKLFARQSKVWSKGQSNPQSGYVTKSILQAMEVIAWTRAPNEENRLHAPHTNSRYCRYGHAAKWSIHTQGHYLDKVCDLSSIVSYVSFTNSIKLAKINQAILITRIACAKSSRHQIMDYARIQY